MQRGTVTSVCPSPDEAVWVTNFKRGVLSALQLTLPSIRSESETIIEVKYGGKSCFLKYKLFAFIFKHVLSLFFFGNDR